ncbi:S-adenosyl-L-methionine-dependent methyltransferase [Aspergillus varians]
MVEVNSPSDILLSPISTQPTSLTPDRVNAPPVPALGEGSDLEDTDSGYSGSSVIGYETKTLPSYVTDYRFEYGRRYHAFHDGAYWGPNDKHAEVLQELAHRMYYTTLGNRLYLAPLVTPQEILDVGTGTGIWAIETADEYPSARVTGVDLSPIQPSFVPPNCSFEVDDVTMPWTYASNRFDLIHVREMFGSIPDWDTFFRQCWECLRPGGYVEVVEHSVEPISEDGGLGSNHIYPLWGESIALAGQASGKSFSIWRDSAQRLKDTGFQDVVRLNYRWPTNGSGTDARLCELGRQNQIRLHHEAEDISLRLLTSTLKWPYKLAQDFIAQMRFVLKHDETHAYVPVTVVYGRKPDRTSNTHH